MRQILYGINVSYADETLKNSSKAGKSVEQIKKEEEQIREKALQVVNRLTANQKYNDFGPVINDILHEMHPEAAGIEVRHASVDNWQMPSHGDDGKLLFDDGGRLVPQTYPKFTLEMNYKLSEEQQNMIVDAVNNLITNQLSDTFEPCGTIAGKNETTVRKFNFNNAWDPDKVKRYFKESEAVSSEDTDVDEDFAAAVSSIYGTADKAVSIE